MRGSDHIYSFLTLSMFKACFCLFLFIFIVNKERDRTIEKKIKRESGKHRKKKKLRSEREGYNAEQRNAPPSERERESHNTIMKGTNKANKPFGTFN